MNLRKRTPRALSAANLSQNTLATWLEELGFKVQVDEDKDLSFDLTPYFSGFLLIGDEMVELLVMQSFEHLDASVGSQIVSQLNGRRFAPKWLMREENTVICAYRFDWLGEVTFPAFARSLRVFGAQAMRGFQWIEQADSAARRLKEEQAAENDANLSGAVEGGHSESADTSSGRPGNVKLLH
jgi:hypothetical protein